MTRLPTSAMPGDDGARASSSAGQGWLMALVGYFALQVALRLTVSDSVELDEAEQLLWSQDLALGYGAQPPLYTWLQWAVFQLTGVSVLGLSLLKNLLLASTYAFTFLAARTVMPASTAALASASMLLLPQIGWESQRDLTHSVIATSMAACMLWQVMRLLQRPTWGGYVVLGLATGLGLLGKYSVAAHAATLLCALLIGRDSRHVVLDRRFALSVLVAALVVLPHGLWLLDHAAEATQGTLAKLDGDTAARGWAAGVLAGLGSLALAIVAFLTPCWIVLLAVFGRDVRAASRRPAAGPAARAHALLRRDVLLLLLVFLAMVLAGVATEFKDRWMQPYLFLAPLILFTRVPSPAEGSRRALVATIAGMALLVVVGLSARVPYHARQGAPDELNLPMRDFAEALAREGLQGGTLVATDHVLGGGLRLHLPGTRVLVARGPQALPPLPRGPVWWVSRQRDPASLRALVERARARAATPDGAAPVIRTIERPYRGAPAGAPPARLAWTVQP